MDLDRNVSDYMQRRNILATKVAGIISAEMLLMAVFFCAYLLLKNGVDGAMNLGTLRILIKAGVVILSLVIALCGIIVMNRFRHMFDELPDDIGLRQSHEVVEYAFSIARPALIFKMTMALVIAAAGIALSLILSILIDDFNAGIYLPKCLLFLLMAVAIFLFIPSFDRLLTYREMLSKYGILKSDISRRSFLVCGMGFFIFLSASMCIYILWRYFGPDSTIAWIVFYLAGLLFGAIVLLTDFSNRLT